MRRKALLIGVNQYHLLGNLSYARQDAEAVADVLKTHCGFSDSEITLMTCGSSGATRANARFIEYAMSDLTEYRDLDLLIFGFWGHGFAPVPGKRYLCGIDTVEKDLERTAVSLDLAKARLAQVGAFNTLLLLDCCQNRPAGRSAGAAVLEKGAELQLVSMARDIQAAHSEEGPIEHIPTVAIMNSCREGQKAYEWDDRQHGVFTAHLLDGIESGETSIAQLSTFVCDRTPLTVRKLHREKQTPWFTIEGKGDILLSEGTGKTIDQPKIAAEMVDKILPEAEAPPPAPDAKAVVEKIRKWVENRKANWEDDEWKDFVISLYDDGCAVGMLHSKLEKIRDREKKAWIKAEETRKAEEARIAEERRRAAEEAERRRRKAEEARKRREEEQLFDEIKNSPSISLCERYLNQYPDGRYLRKVKKTLDHLRDKRKGQFRLIKIVSVLVIVVAVTSYVGISTLMKKQSITSEVKEVIQMPLAKAPFDSTKAKKYQQQTADALGVSVEKKVDLGGGIEMEFVLIPAGEFIMGRPSTEKGRGGGEGPQHRVRISKDFYMGITEVTQGQWKAVMSSNPSYFKGDNLPVEQVSWNDVTEFCKKLSQKRGEHYRLPTEAEWEYACRAGTTKPFSTGETISTNRANYDDIVYRRQTTEVGSFAPNAFGLYDMHGNVWEWCQDVWHSSYIDAPSDGSAWITGDDVGLRVRRGGSWSSTDCRSANRDFYYPGGRRYDHGFRVVLEIETGQSDKSVEVSKVKEREVRVKTSEVKEVTEMPLAKAPFDSDKANEYQQQTADTLGVSLEEKVDLGGGIEMEFVLIPAGEFMMGSSLSAAELAKEYNAREEFFKDEYPQHKVTISTTFYMSKTEVTQGQYKAVMNSEPWSGRNYVQQSDNNPAVYVSWDDAVKFCEKLSQKEGRTYRLPTEAQWEYACRAGTTTRYSFGDSKSSLGEYAWIMSNTWFVRETYARAVGQKKPNNFGLYDMHGNVVEWCSDWYDSNYYMKSPPVDPKGPSSGKYRVLRGGSWSYIPWLCRSADRHMYSPDLRPSVIGFRVVVQDF